MNCQTVQTLMPFRNRTGELSSDDADRLERHLAECSECSGLAARGQPFDRAVARAMNAVPVPGDLRSTIELAMVVESARVWRRKLARWSVVAVAALVFLAVGLGWWNSKVTFWPEQFVQDADHNFILLANGSRDSAEEYFRGQGLRTQLPSDLDYTLLANLTVTEYSGKNVARLDFQRGAARCVVYVLPRRDFRLPRAAARDVAGSQCTVDVIDADGGYYYVMVFMGGGNRQMFLPQAVVG